MPTLLAFISVARSAERGRCPAVRTIGFATNAILIRSIVNTMTFAKVVTPAGSAWTAYKSLRVPGIVTLPKPSTTGVAIRIMCGFPLIDPAPDVIIGSAPSVKTLITTTGTNGDIDARIW